MARRAAQGQPDTKDTPDEVSGCIPLCFVCLFLMRVCLAKAEQGLAMQPLNLVTLCNLEAWLVLHICFYFGELALTFFVTMLCDSLCYNIFIYLDAAVLLCTTEQFRCVETHSPVPHCLYTIHILYC